MGNRKQDSGNLEPGKGTPPPPQPARPAGRGWVEERKIIIISITWPESHRQNHIGKSLCDFPYLGKSKCDSPYLGKSLCDFAYLGKSLCDFAYVILPM